VRVAGTSFNPLDASIRAGHLQQVFPVALPHTPGLDVAGTIAALGAGVTRFEVGDRVVGLLPLTADGAAADYVTAPVEALTWAPTAIPLAHAAALPTVGLSAWQSVFEHADMRPGQRVLVNGASGAVGGHAVQLAHRAGATVIATAGPCNSDRVRGYGADQVVDHTTQRVADEITAPVDTMLNFARSRPRTWRPWPGSSGPVACC
jgi:NADPH:quinone reductase-like Zn-dependent oxidoreductase